MAAVLTRMLKPPNAKDAIDSHRPTMATFLEYYDNFAGVAARDILAGGLAENLIAQSDTILRIEMFRANN